METPSLPPKTRMKALFAIVAIALLLVGLGAGYLLGRPVPAAIPGPVSGLLRTMIPRVDGWFRNASVSYLDFGPQSNVAVPILAFFQATSPSTPVAGQSDIIWPLLPSGGTDVTGQRNVIDALPGNSKYSDLWNVVKVVVDPSYVANDLKDARSILAANGAGQLNLEMTTIYVNCPVVS